MANTKTCIPPHPFDDVRTYPCCSGHDPMTMEEELKASKVWETKPEGRTANLMTYIQSWYLFSIQDVLAQMPLAPSIAQKHVIPVLLANPLGRFRMERAGYHLAQCGKKDCECLSQPQRDLSLTLAPVCFNGEKIPQEYWKYTLWQICGARIHIVDAAVLTASVRFTIGQVLDKAGHTVQNYHRMEIMVDEMLLLRTYFARWIEFSRLWIKSDPAVISAIKRDSDDDDDIGEKKRIVPPTPSPQFFDSVREYPLCRMETPMTMYEELKRARLLKLSDADRTRAQLSYLHVWYRIRLQSILDTLPLSPILVENLILPILLYHPSGRFRVERVGYHLAPCSKPECGCQAQPDIALSTSPVCFDDKQAPQGYWPFTAYQLCATKVDIDAAARLKRMQTCIETVFTLAWPTVQNRYRMHTMLDEMQLLRVYFKDWLVLSNPWSPVVSGK